MRFWMSWWTREFDPDDIPFKAWVTGERVRDDFSTEAVSICAVADAESEEAAWALAREFYPDLEKRFCEPKPSDFEPGDRFPKE